MFASGLLAQTAEDALRFSSMSTTGSSRFMSLSGAMGSVGGDLSTINYNPAGMGIYKGSEYVFAPRYLYNKTEASYGGDFRSDKRDNFNFGMVGLVSTMALGKRNHPDAQGWKNIQFGFSINRVDNYRSDVFIEGASYGGSKVFEWRDEANGSYPDDLNLFSANLAWETYLLDTINGYPRDYAAAVPNEGIYQSYSSQTEGYKNEMSFAMSGNYNNRLFVGATMSFVFLNYYRSTFLRESALENPNPGEFDSFTYREELGTRGNGFNAKFGLIYVPIPMIRISAAMHTPTWFYRMSDTYFTSVQSQMSDGEVYSKSSPNGRYDYKLYTPLRFMGGLSVFIQDKGFISLDYDYVNYQKAYLKSSSFVFTEENENINNDFAASHSLRIGTEWRLQAFMFRAGYGISTSPVDESINTITHDQYSFGIGYRSGPFYMDAAFMQKYNTQNYYMYNAAYVSPAFLESRTSYYSLTLGFRF